MFTGTISSASYFNMLNCSYAPGLLPLPTSGNSITPSLKKCYIHGLLAFAPDGAAVVIIQILSLDFKDEIN